MFQTTLRIPAKANADSEGNANGVPDRRRTVLGAQRRWHLDCAGTVRLRQEKLSGAQRRKDAAAGMGVWGKGQQSLAPPQRTVARSAIQRSELKALTCQVDDHP